MRASSPIEGLIELLQGNSLMIVAGLVVLAIIGGLVVAVYRNKKK